MQWLIEIPHRNGLQWEIVGKKMLQVRAIPIVALFERVNNEEKQAEQNDL